MNDRLKCLDLPTEEQRKKLAQQDKQDANKAAKSVELSFIEAYKTDSPSVVINDTVHRWIGTHWQALADKDVEAQALHWLIANRADVATEKKAKSCAATLKLSLPVRKMGKCNKVPFLNGTLDLTTFELKESSQSDFLTYLIDVDYDPEARAPMFNRFIEEAVPDELTRAYLQAYTGYTLQADTRFQCGVWLLGGGGNGKGEFSKIVRACHAKPAVMSLSRLDGFAVTPLIDASLVLVDETPARIDEQALKSIISGNNIPVDRKHRDPIDVEPKAKWICQANKLPQISDHSDGFWRRWAVIPFDQKPKEKIMNLGQLIIDSELPGVVNWMVDGLRIIKALGDKLPPFSDEIEEQISRGKEQSDSALAWLRDKDIDVKEEANTKKTDVYDHYTLWCSQNGVKALSKANFFERLDKHMGQYLITQRVRIDGQREYCCNIELPRQRF